MLSGLKVKVTVPPALPLSSIVNVVGAIVNGDLAPFTIAILTVPFDLSRSVAENVNCCVTGTLIVDCISVTFTLWNVGSYTRPQRVASGYSYIG